MHVEGDRRREPMRQLRQSHSKETSHRIHNLRHKVQVGCIKAKNMGDKRRRFGVNGCSMRPQQRETLNKLRLVTIANVALILIVTAYVAVEATSKLNHEIRFKRQVDETGSETTTVSAPTTSSEDLTSEASAASTTTSESPVAPDALSTDSSPPVQVEPASTESGSSSPTTSATEAASTTEEPPSSTTEEPPSSTTEEPPSSTTEDPPGSTSEEPISSTPQEPSSTTTTEAAITTTIEIPRERSPHVNFTEIDEIFSRGIDEKLATEKWNFMDKQLTAGINAILKVVSKPMVDLATDAKLNGSCKAAMLEWLINIKKLRVWAIKMLDATGKPTAGILEGSLSMLGNYRECLSVRAPDIDETEETKEFKEYFRGQYCVLQLKPYLPQKPTFYSLNSKIPSLLKNKTASRNKPWLSYERSVYDELSELALAFNFATIRADLCMPSLCSREDIQKLASFIANKVEMRARVSRCDMEPIKGVRQVDDSQLAWIVICGFFIALVLISTLANLMLASGSKGSKSNFSSLVDSMSLKRSFNYVKDVNLDRVNHEKPVFLYSLKLIVLLWIFLVSLISQMDFNYLREMLPLRDMIMELPMQLVVNSTLQFDALILISAFIYSYQNINSNVTDLIKYNVGKYFRLMPSIMLLVGVTILTPLFYMNRSPIWHDFVDTPAQVCESRGWVNMLFLQNFLDYNQICLPQTWIFCVELQLAILAIPIVNMFSKSFDANHGRFKLLSLPSILLIGATALGCIVNYLNIYNNSLPPAWFLTYPDKDDKARYFSLHLYRTSSHLTAYAMGLLFGHLCRCKSISTFSGRPYGLKICQTLMLFTSFTLMVCLIYGTHAWSLGGRVHLDAPVESALYGALAPLGWSLAWGLLLFRLTVPNASSTSKGESYDAGLLRLLTIGGSMLVRIGRLGFLAYLINPYVNMMVFAIQETTIFSSIVMVGHMYIGNVFFTFLLAIIVSVLVEIPIRRLVKKLALGSRRQTTNFEIIARQSNVLNHVEMPVEDLCCVFHVSDTTLGPDANIEGNSGCCCVE